MKKLLRSLLFSLLVIAIGTLGYFFYACNSSTYQANNILKKTGIEGGLVVHVGCGDGKLTAALRVNDSYLVHGLDRDEKNIEKSRAYIQSLGLYGKVSVEKWQGKQLPYIDNLVNLLVVEDIGELPEEEVQRVLCPEGIAYINKDNEWTKTIKSRSEKIDEWTHYLYDPTNNAVSHDVAIDHLRHLQWIGGQNWSRHHDHMSSSTAIVSAGGRNFYIFDEGSAASIQLPSKWFLIARDAFNGKVLWKKPMEKWHTQLWHLKSGPADLPRRIVAYGDTLYATLSLHAPVTALEAATGKTIRTYPDTYSTEEILYSDGDLFLVINHSPKDQPTDPKQHDYYWKESPRTLMALQAATGKVLWQKEWRWIVPVTLALNKKNVFFFDGERIICLDRKNGEEQWQSTQIGRRLAIPSYFAPTLVVYKDVVLFSGADTESKGYHFDNGKSLVALDITTGKTLWTSEHPPSGYRSPEDILVIDDLVWTDSFMWGYSRDGFDQYRPGLVTGRDLHTGAIKTEFTPDVETYWFHHRCYRAKATDRYLLASRTGIEFVDLKNQHWTCHHWVRGACLYGILPANGLIYTTPHPCACYLEAKLYGFNALAPVTPSRLIPEQKSSEERLYRGPAYGEEVPSVGQQDDWPTYRHDLQRSGFSKTNIPAQLQKLWEVNLEGLISSISIAENKLFVASIGEQTLHAFDTRSGHPVWSYAVGGKVDSPPTIWQGRVLFGSADGYIYCLRASDGTLIWRFRAAPLEQRLVAYEQVESVWPVHGNVLVKDGAVWCVAGRSMFLDGGLRLISLDAKTGHMLLEKILDEKDPESGENLQVHVKGLDMPVALPDILSGDENYVYMRSLQFDKNGNRLNIEAPLIEASDQKGEGAHLFSPTGFLDEDYWHRSYWIYGKRWKSGAGGYFLSGRFAPSGRILVFNDSTVYGFGRKPQYYKWTTPLEDVLFATEKDPEIIQLAEKKKKGFSAGRPVEYKFDTHWTEDIPIYVRAMVLADKTIFIAGPPNRINEVESLQNFQDPTVQAQLIEESDALEGKNGSFLWAVSVQDGSKLAEYKLDGLPVWDGMAAANGQLYLSTTDGRVLCLGTDQ